MQGTQWGRAKSMQAHSPKNGSASQRKLQERFKRCRVARAVLQQACEVEPWPSGSAQDPGRNPRHPQTSKLTYFRTLQNSYTRKAARLAFVSGNIDSCMGSGAMFACAYPHTSHGSSVKFAIRIGLAAKPLRMCSRATKHGVAFRIGWAAKLLRTRSKATKDDFAVRIGSAAKLLRKCSKDCKK